MNKLKKVVRNGDTRLLPAEALESDFEMGIPLALDFSRHYPEPINSQVVDALLALGVSAPGDWKKPGINELIRQALQYVIKLDVNTILKMMKEDDDATDKR